MRHKSIGAIMIAIMIAIMVISVLLCSCGRTKGEGISESNLHGGQETATENVAGKKTGGLSAESKNGIAEENHSGQLGKDEKPMQEELQQSEIPEGVALGDMQGPVFSAASGCYNEEFILHIDVPEGCTCYYTLDGSNPLTAGCGYLYDDAKGIRVYDRVGEPNVVNTVPTSLYDAANVKVNPARNGFNTTSKNPSDNDIDKCMVIRAVLIDSAQKASATTTATYFIGNVERHIPGLVRSNAAAKEAGFAAGPAVISITANFEDFFDYDRGIYVKGRFYDEAIAELVASKVRIDNDTSRRVAANYNQKGREWEREVHIDFFEADENGITLAISQDCGIRIQGNYSRSDLQKGFRLYARSEYGAKNFKYPIFGDDVKAADGETLKKYKSLILRNGGNCAFTTKWSADYWAYMAKGLCCESMASRPAVVYLNGEYWGLYVLEENYSADYFEDKYGVDKESVVLYKGDAESLELGYKLDIGELPKGVNSQSYYFDSLLDFFETHKDLKREEDYEAFCRIVDPDSVRDYFAVETWINNKWDWPGKNWSMWRVASQEKLNTSATADALSDADTVIDDAEAGKYNDGRWRFCFYDMEFGGVSGEGDAYVNTIREDNYKTYGLLDMDTSNPAVLCFAYCMTNEDFRNSFYTRLRSLSKVIFARGRAQNVLEGFGNVYAPLYEQFFKAYPGTGSMSNSLNGGYASKKCISDFIDRRYDNIEPMIDWCEKHFD